MIVVNRSLLIELVLSLLVLLSAESLSAKDISKIPEQMELPQDETFKNPIDIYKNFLFNLKTSTFVKGVTEQQKQLFYIAAIDSHADYVEHFRFDRTES